MEREKRRNEEKVERERKRQEALRQKEEGRLRQIQERERRKRLMASEKEKRADERRRQVSRFHSGLQLVTSQSSGSSFVRSVICDASGNKIFLVLIGQVSLCLSMSKEMSPLQIWHGVKMGSPE